MIINSVRTRLGRGRWSLPPPRVAQLDLNLLTSQLIAQTEKLRRLYLNPHLIGGSYLHFCTIPLGHNLTDGRKAYRIDL